MFSTNNFQTDLNIDETQTGTSTTSQIGPRSNKREASHSLELQNWILSTGSLNEW